MKIIPLWIYFAAGMALSLVGNAWQWQNRTGNKAEAKAAVNLCVGANDAQDQALAACKSRMWEEVAGRATDAAANKRVLEQHARDSATALRDAEKRNEEFERANRDASCQDWANAPVCPAVSRLLTKGRGEANGARGAGPNGEGDAGRKPDR